ncbi:hypothetical protein ATY35_09615 [Vibrio cidicii]|uniref:Holin n=1 Tax=Vibrio cidicii TaxID=1763883 RepID=A0ABR5W6P8_9VIBR|nr:MULTISPECIES: hypothetical protein [Vibrio]KYN90540.1 hypothetical protein ATY35_09615 [Vibrio cidicii]MBE4575517.1 hypothetical protein [Vibrio navarrensis]HAT8515210.1 hypothetical protein [Vibrio vulnificus]HDY8008050.1 hypothetical protein [Vibrio vulnificus]
MVSTLLNWWQQLQEWKGRLIVYLGGGGISFFSESVTARAREVAEAAAAIPDPVVFNPYTTAGLVFVGGRLVFDIFVYLDQRRMKKRRERDGRKATE